MTFTTSQRVVRSVEGEIFVEVFKELPAAFVMTVLTIASKLTFVMVIFFMTIDAV